MPGAFVWSSVSTGDAVRVLPDGCMDLLWDGDELVIAGADTHAHVVERPAGAPMTGLRFAPGQAPRVLGAPADVFTNDRVALDSVWSPARVREVADDLAASCAPGTVLEELALAASTPADADADAALIEHVAALAAAGCNSTAIAAKVGLSTRQLQRRSAAAFGYGAKTLGRVLRMQHALALARRGVRAADAAARTGYADQSHLARGT